MRSFETLDAWTPESVMLVAHLMFDGEIGRACVYNNRSGALIERVERLMRVLYAYPPKRYQNPVTGVWRISYYNVALAAHLREKAKELLARIQAAPYPHKAAFLRAFFDDEGCMDFRPDEKRRQVRGYQKNVLVLRIVRRLLADSGVESRLVVPNEVVVSGKENLLAFQAMVGFSEGISVNGNRSNSRWKRHVEKRQLLRMAIESYEH